MTEVAAGNLLRKEMAVVVVKTGSGLSHAGDNLLPEKDAQSRGVLREMAMRRLTIGHTRGLILSLVPTTECRIKAGTISGVRIRALGTAQTHVLKDTGSGIHGFLAGSGLKDIAIDPDIAQDRIFISGSISGDNAP